MNKRIDWLLSLLSPHICKDCNKVGDALCNRCIINMTHNIYPICLICKRSCKNDNLCPACRSKPSQPFDNIIAIGRRVGPLKSLVGDYKYNSEIASADVIARLLDERLKLCSNGDYSKFTIVPIPTIDKHIRERGFNHMVEVAKSLSKLRSQPLNNKLLFRTNNISQHNLSKSDRQKLIGQSIQINSKGTVPGNIILLDDIWTTDSTLLTTAQKLKKAGAQHIIGLVVAFQLNNK